LLKLLLKVMNKKGFVSLINLIVTVAVIAVLAVGAFVWIDPVARIGVAHDKKRTEDIGVLKNALAQYANEHKGALPILGDIDTNKKVLCSTQSGNNLTCDGESQLCLAIDDSDFLAKYINELPVDPDKTSATDSGYFLKKDSNNKLVVGACTKYGASPVVATTTTMVNCSTYGGGYCWNISGDNQTCDTYCDSINKECLDLVDYGPEAGDADCLLNLAYGACGTSCTANTGNNPPKVLANYSACYYQTNPVDCSVAAGSGYFNICPCQ